MTAPSAAVLGIDPGHAKCGLALLAADGRALSRCVAPTANLQAALTALTEPCGGRPAVVVLGNGTHSAAVAAEVEAVWPAQRVVSVDEMGTTLLARSRYWRENPPRGLWRLVPTSLRLPPEPYDDWVAVLLAERWLAAQAG